MLESLTFLFEMNTNLFQVKFWLEPSEKIKSN